MVIVIKKLPILIDLIKLIVFNFMSIIRAQNRYNTNKAI